MINDCPIAGVIRRFYHGLPPAMMVDVGVGDGRESWSLHKEFPRMLLFGFEPNDPTRKALQEYPGYLYPYGLWSHATMHHFKEQGDQSTCFVEGDTQVELRPLDEWQFHNAVLWADVEGAELEVLRGAWRLLYEKAFSLINLEVRPLPLHPGACTEAEVDAFLSAFGYAKVLTYNVHQGSDPHWDTVYVHHTRIRTW